MIKHLLVIGMLAVTGCQPGEVDTGSDVEGTQSANLDDGTAVQTVCFWAHNGADPNATLITGSLFHAPWGPSTPVVIAAHGIAGDRSVFDGGGNSALGSSFARNLAHAGYAVITYDRIGYGQSKYAGLGKDITPDNQVDALHEIVGQVRGGKYWYAGRDAAGNTTCKVNAHAPAFGSKNIVIAGHSFGGFMATNYAGKYHDVEAIIPMGSSTSGFSNEFVNKIFVPYLYPHATTDDYVIMFPKNPTGPVSQDCAHFFFYAPGASQTVINAVCGNDKLKPTPSGEILNLPPFALGETRTLISQIGNIPVLLGLTDHDLFFKGPEEASADDPDVQTPELQYYKDNCGCQVNLFDQDDSGHMFMFHLKAAQMANKVINWLTNHGIDGDPV